jgi:hypothetical protein
VVWNDQNLEILYRRSLNNRDTFPNIILNVSNDPDASSLPVIAVLDSNLYVIWRGSGEVWYRPSIDNGSTFDPMITNLSTNSGFSAATGLGMAAS